MGGHFWPIGVEMDNDKERYFDFSEDEELLRQFDPDLTSDSYLKMTAGVMQNHLRFRNPLSRIAGLVAHNSGMSDGYNLALHVALKRITWLLAAITILLAYIAYVLTLS